MFVWWVATRPEASATWRTERSRRGSAGWMHTCFATAYAACDRVVKAATLSSLTIRYVVRPFGPGRSLTFSSARSTRSIEVSPSVIQTSAAAPAGTAISFFAATSARPTEKRSACREKLNLFTSRGL